MPPASTVPPARRAVAVAVALPVLLAVVVAVLALVNRGAADPSGDPPETGPLDAGTVAAPDASSQACSAVLARLGGALPADGGELAPRPVEPPAAGVRAWAAAPEPVVLRCGVPRPSALGPSSPLLVINGVNWLPLPDASAGSATTYAVVDRAVYLTVTAPAAAGSGPLQRVSDAVAGTLPQTPVRVR